MEQELILTLSSSNHSLCKNYYSYRESGSTWKKRYKNLYRESVLIRTLSSSNHSLCKKYYSYRETTLSVKNIIHTERVVLYLLPTLRSSEILTSQNFNENFCRILMRDKVRMRILQYKKNI